MKQPLLFTRAVPKFNMIARILWKEFSKFLKYCSWVNLIRVNWRVEDLLGSMKGVCDNHYMIDIGIGDCLIYFTLYSKQFSFGCNNVDSSVLGFDDRFIEEMNMWYQSGNVIFDTGIRHNNCWWEIGWCPEHNFI